MTEIFRHFMKSLILQFTCDIYTVLISEVATFCPITLGFVDFERKHKKTPE